jgi:hypothetical protein
MKQNFVREKDSIFIVEEDGKRYEVVQSRVIVKFKSETEKNMNAEIKKQRHFY